MRSLYKEEFQNKYQVKLGFMSFFVKACVIGLKNYPSINAELIRAYRIRGHLIANLDPLGLMELGII